MNDPNPIDSLCESIAACDSAFRLMELLMHFCRDQVAVFREWDEVLANHASVPTAQKAAKLVVDNFGGVVFTPEDPHELLEGIRSAITGYVRQDEPPPVVRAELLVQVFGSVFTPKLRSLYPDWHSGSLASKQLFPVYWPNLKKNGWFQKDKLSTPPSSLSQPPGYLPYWGLAPGPEVFSGRRVEFVFAGRTNVSQPIPGPLILAVGVLNAAADELTWERISGSVSDPTLRFRDVRPRPETRDFQVAAMCQLADLAASKGVGVLVFPELCIDRPGAETVFNHIAGLNKRPALIVIGSHHWFDGKDRRNTCVAIRSGPTPDRLEHHKLTRYIHSEDGQQWLEDIRLGTSIRVYVGTDWSVILLICRDFLDTTVRLLVESLRPTLLCIPSFSLTSTPFVDPAGALTANAQTIVVFANGPVPPDRVVGVFGVPRTREPGAGSVSLARQALMPEPLPTLPCLMLYEGTLDQIIPCPVDTPVVT
jgi:hypothetical protein